MTSVVRNLTALSLALVALFAAPAFALDTGDIVVDSVKGDVRVTMNGAARTVRAGGVLELPAIIDTGRDGAIDLRQGATTISVGPESRLEFPAPEQRGGAIDRIVQPLGNAFYNIGKRAGRRLRVETPYLVGVIKGTQFNIAAQDGATTISLFEGLLEVRATDDSSVIDLSAGEIASRKRGGQSISVIKMEGGSTPPAQRAPPAPGGGGRSQAPSAPGPERDANDDSLLADRGDRGLGGTTGEPLTPASPSVADPVRGVAVAGAAIDLGGDARGNDAGANLSTGIATNAANASVDIGAALDAGNVAVDVDAGASAGGGAGSVSAGVGLDVGSAVDVGVAANVNAGAGAVDVGANAAIDAGPLTADTGTAVTVDTSAGSVGANVDLSAGAGVGNVAGVDTGAAAGIDLGTHVDAAANVDVGANVAGVGATVTAGVNVAAGNVDLGVNVGGVNLGLDLDLDDDNSGHGSGTDRDDNNGHGNDTDHTDNSNPGSGGGSTPAPTTPVVDVGGLLDGILNRHRRK